MDRHVGRLALRPAHDLMDQDFAVRQDAPLTFGPGRQQQRRRRCRQSDADRRHVSFDILHRVIDRQGRRHLSAGRIDIQLDVFLGILRIQKQQLGNDAISHAVVDRSAQKDDAVLQQARIDIIGPFSIAGLFDNGRNKILIACDTCHIF